ncbi:MAG: hypothetical protein QOF55_514, partial [Thermoleophilaceae bacterium]|nr:hypothetical protein [Thermoleophilaceae bacterium]
SRVRVLPRSFVMVLTAALAFWVLTALARAQIGEPANPRYLYPGGLLVLLIAAEALRGWRPSRRGLILVGVVVLFGVLSGLKGFKDGANGLRATEGVFQAELTPLEIGAGHMSPDFQPDQQRAPQVVTGLYLDAVRSIGSSPAYTESQLASLDEGRKQLADGVFVRGYGLALTPGAAVGAGAAPVADPTSEAVVQTRGSCVVGRSVNPAGGASVALMVPPDGISLRAPGASVSLRRFADGFGGVPPLQGDASNAALRIPRDRSARPWHVVLQNTQRFTACGLGA